MSDRPVNFFFLSFLSFKADGIIAIEEKKSDEILQI